MQARAFSKSSFSCLLLAVAVLSTDLSTDLSGQDDAAGGARRRRGRGVYGDWAVKIEYGERQFDSILAFGRNAEGKRSAQLISFRGLTDLTEVSLENGELKFTYERKNREGESVVSKFTGKIADGKISGVLKDGDNERKLTGERRPWTRRAVGTWDIEFKVGEREVSNQIYIIANGKDDLLAVDWRSSRAQHKISDVKYERGKLSFKAHSKLEEREWDATFDGTVRGNELKGKITVGENEIDVAGTRAGAAAIGTWSLEIAAGEDSDRAPRKQRLRIHSDMTGLFGSLPIQDVSLKDGALSFKAVLKFGDRSFEMDFSGKIEESKISGELKTTRGTRKITGTKVQRRRPRRNRDSDRPADPAKTI